MRHINGERSLKICTKKWQEGQGVASKQKAFQFPAIGFWKQQQQQQQCERKPAKRPTKKGQEKKMY